MSIIEQNDGPGLYINNIVKTSTEFLAYTIKIGALVLKESGTKLKSGRVSPYFFNSGLFNDGETLLALARFYAKTMVEQDLSFDAIYGPAYKGIPLAAAVAMVLKDKYSINVGYAFNRKEEKDHGEGGLVVGVNLSEKRVLIIDDVITSGESKDEAIKFVASHGGTPVGCIIAFDRQEKIGGAKDSQSAAQVFEFRHNIPIIAIATLADLIDMLINTPAESGDDESGEMLGKILAYKEKYGA